MNDLALVLRQGYATTKYDAYGVTSAVSAAGNVTADGNTGYVKIAPNGNPPGIPLKGMAVLFEVPGITTTGAPTALNLTLTVTFSDDGSAQAGPTYTTPAKVISITSNAASSNVYYFRIPVTPHAYIKVAWATTITGGSSPTYNYGSVNIALEPRADSMIGLGVDMAA